MVVVSRRVKWNYQKYIPMGNRGELKIVIMKRRRRRKSLLPKRRYKISLDEPTHIYYVNGRAIKTSVSKVIRNLFPKFNSVNQAKKYVKKHKIKKHHLRVSHKWKQNGIIAKNKGIKGHKIIENYYKKGEFPDILRHPLRPELTNFCKFDKYLKNSGTNILASEYRLSAFGIAGTIDLIVERKGEIHIIDWKFAKKCTYIPWNKFADYPFNDLPDAKIFKYAIQLNLYAKMLHDHGVTVSGMYVVRFYKSEMEVLEIESLGEKVNKLVLTLKRNKLGRKKKK